MSSWAGNTWRLRRFTVPSPSPWKTLVLTKVVKKRNWKKKHDSPEDFRFLIKGWRDLTLTREGPDAHNFVFVFWNLNFVFCIFHLDQRGPRRPPGSRFRRERALGIHELFCRWHLLSPGFKFFCALSSWEDNSHLAAMQTINFNLWRWQALK